MAADGTVVECVRCQAKTKDDSQCKRRTCKYSKYCFQHTKALTGLQIKKSSIPRAGMGLWTTKDIPANATITQYGGELIDLEEEERRDSGYGVQVLPKQNLVRDGRSTQSGLGRWINQCRQQNRVNPPHCRNNAKFSVNTKKKSVSIKTLKDKSIPAGSEIFIGYGQGYWKS